jgi:hypothetical protein
MTSNHRAKARRRPPQSVQQPVAVSTSALDRDIGSSARQNEADRQLPSGHPLGFGNQLIRGGTFENWAGTQEVDVRLVAATNCNLELPAGQRT